MKRKTLKLLSKKGVFSFGYTLLVGIIVSVGLIIITTQLFGSPKDAIAAPPPEDPPLSRPECIGKALAEYMNALCAGGIPSNVKLLSPAFNLSHPEFPEIAAAMTKYGANWGCLTGLAGNAYHVSGQPTSHWLNIGKAAIPIPKPWYLTEAGYHDFPRPGNFIDIMKGELSPGQIPGVRAALWYNATNTGSSHWDKFAIDDNQSRDIVSANPGVLGVNFTTMYERPDHEYKKIADLGYKWSLEIAHASNRDSAKKGINQAHAHGVMPIVRIGVGTDDTGFFDPAVYAQFLKDLSTDVGNKPFYAIAGPNEPSLENWIAPHCGAVPQWLSACNNPAGYQPISSGIVVGYEENIEIKGRLSGSWLFERDPGSLVANMTITPGPSERGDYNHQRIHNPIVDQYAGHVLTIDAREATLNPASWLRALPPDDEVEEYETAVIPTADARYENEAASSFMQRALPEEAATLQVPPILGCITEKGSTDGHKVEFSGTIDYDLPPALRYAVRSSQLLKNRIFDVPGGWRASAQESLATSPTLHKNENETTSILALKNPKPVSARAVDCNSPFSITIDNVSYSGGQIYYAVALQNTPDTGGPQCHLYVNGNFNGGCITPGGVRFDAGSSSGLVNPVPAGPNGTYTISANAQLDRHNPCGVTPVLSVSCEVVLQNGVIQSTTCAGTGPPPSSTVNCYDCPTWATHCPGFEGVQQPIENLCVDGICKAGGIISESPGKSVCRWDNPLEWWNCAFSQNYDFFFDVTFINKYREITGNTNDTLHTAISLVPGMTEEYFEVEWGEEPVNFVLNLEEVGGAARFAANGTQTLSVTTKIPFIDYSSRLKTFCLTMAWLHPDGFDGLPFDECKDFIPLPEIPDDIPPSACTGGVFTWNNARTTAANDGTTLEELIDKYGAFNLMGYIDVADPISWHYPEGTSEPLYYNLCAAANACGEIGPGEIFLEMDVPKKGSGTSKMAFFFKLAKSSGGIKGDIAIDLQVPLGVTYRIIADGGCHQKINSGNRKSKGEDICLLKNMFARVDNSGEGASNACYTDPHGCNYPRPKGVDLGHSGEFWAEYLEDGGTIKGVTYPASGIHAETDWVDAPLADCEISTSPPFPKGDYPKTFAVILSNVSDYLSRSYAGRNLGNVLKNFDMVAIPVESGETWTHEGTPSVNWLQDRNPDQLQFAFTPLWYIVENVGVIRTDHARQVRDNGWVLKNTDGTDTTWYGAEDLVSIDMTIQEHNPWSIDFWTDNIALKNSAWDGIEGDYQANVDYSLKRTNVWPVTYDRYEYRIAYQNSMKEIFNGIHRSGLNIMGNASWQPTPDTFDIPFAGHVDATIFEDFPVLDPASDPQKWGYSESGGFKSGWDRAIYISHLLNLKGTESVFINSENLGIQGYRFGLSTALIADAYYGTKVRGYTHGPWYPEYAVDRNGKSIDPEDPDILNYTGWLGNPKTDAVTTDSGTTLRSMAQSNWQQMGDHIWVRVFDNGLAIVNPMFVEQDIVIPEPPTGEYRRVNGNNKVGPIVKVPARDGLILVKVN